MAAPNIVNVTTITGITTFIAGINTGGDGNNSANGTHAVFGTGSGGGGGGYEEGVQFYGGGNGSGGIVIIAYPS